MGCARRARPGGSEALRLALAQSLSLLGMVQAVPLSAAARSKTEACQSGRRHPSPPWHHHRKLASALLPASIESDVGARSRRGGKQP